MLSGQNTKSTLHGFQFNSKLYSQIQSILSPIHSITTITAIAHRKKGKDVEIFLLDTWMWKGLPSSLTQLIWTGYQSLPLCLAPMLLRTKANIISWSQTQFKNPFSWGCKDPDAGQDTVGNKAKIYYFNKGNTSFGEKDIRDKCTLSESERN